MSSPAPAAVLHARKPELPVEELERQQHGALRQSSRARGSATCSSRRSNRLIAWRKRSRRRGGPDAGRARGEASRGLKPHERNASHLVDGTLRDRNAARLQPGDARAAKIRRGISHRARKSRAGDPGARTLSRPDRVSPARRNGCSARFCASRFHRSSSRSSSRFRATNLFHDSWRDFRRPN